MQFDCILDYFTENMNETDIKDFHHLLLSVSMPLDKSIKPFFYDKNSEIINIVYAWIINENTNLEHNVSKVTFLENFINAIELNEESNGVINYLKRIINNYHSQSELEIQHNYYPNITKVNNLRTILLLPFLKYNKESLKNYNVINNVHQEIQIGPFIHKLINACNDTIRHAVTNSFYPYAYTVNEIIFMRIFISIILPNDRAYTDIYANGCDAGTYDTLSNGMVFNSCIYQKLSNSIMCLCQSALEYIVIVGNTYSFFNSLKIAGNQKDSIVHHINNIKIELLHLLLSLFLRFPVLIEDLFSVSTSKTNRIDYINNLFWIYILKNIGDTQYNKFESTSIPLKTDYKEIYLTSLCSISSASTKSVSIHILSHALNSSSAATTIIGGIFSYYYSVKYSNSSLQDHPVYLILNNSTCILESIILNLCSYLIDDLCLLWSNPLDEVTTQESFIILLYLLVHKVKIFLDILVKSPLNIQFFSLLIRICCLYSMQTISNLLVNTKNLDTNYINIENSITSLTQKTYDISLYFNPNSTPFKLKKLPTIYVRYLLIIYHVITEYKKTLLCTE